MEEAKRRGHWFRLERSRRALFSLAIGLKVRFRSIALMRALVSILKRLKEFGDPAYRRFLIGARIAWAFSEAATNWGNERARSWRNDRRYVTYLGMLFPVNIGP